MLSLLSLSTQAGVLDTLKSKEYKPLIGIGTGYFTYFGEINSRQKSDPFNGYLASSIELSRGILPQFDIGLRVTRGILTGYDTPAFPNLNFRTEIFMGQFHVQYFFNLNKVSQPIVKPFVLVGFESYEFNPKADLMDANGNTYNFWSDGSIRDIAEDDPNSSQAQIIRRDHIYESDLREQNLDGLGKYPLVGFGIPIGVGLSMQVSERISFQLNSTLHYNFNDNVDNISDAGIGVRKGNKAGDHFIHTYASLHYDLLTTSRSIEEGDNVFPDFYALDMGDFDGDGVPNYLDLCEMTPPGVAVDSAGCPIDTDYDGVPNFVDKELRTRDSAYVNEEGVTLTDDDFWYQYLTYIDSLPISVEVLTKMIKRSEKKGVYRVRGGNYDGSVPENEIAVYVEEKDFRAHKKPDGSVDYFTKRYYDLDQAERRKDSLSNKGIANPEIVVEFEGEYITLSDYQKILDEYDRQDSLNIVNQNKAIEGQYVTVLGETPNNANSFEEAKFYEENDPVVLKDEKGNKAYLINPTDKEENALATLEKINKEEFPDAKVMKVVNGELVDPHEHEMDNIIDKHKNKFAISIDLSKKSKEEKERIEKLLDDEIIAEDDKAYGGFTNIKKIAEQKVEALKEAGIEDAEVVQINEHIKPKESTANDFAVKIKKSDLNTQSPPIKSELENSEIADLGDEIITLGGSTEEEVLAKLEEKGISPSKVDIVKNENGDWKPIETVEEVETTEPINDPQDQFAIKIDQDIVNQLSDEAKKQLQDETVTKVADESITLKSNNLEELNEKLESLNIPRKDIEIGTLKNNKWSKLDEEDLTPLADDLEDVVKDGEYAVKVAEFKGPISQENIDKLSSIDGIQSIEMKDGIIYVVGTDKSIEEVKKKLDELKAAGFTNATIVKNEDGKLVDVPKEEYMTSDEINNETESDTQENAFENNDIITKETLFRVQIGAYRNPIPKNTFGNMDVVSFPFADGITRYFTGSYQTYKEAALQKEYIKSKGYSDAFVTAFKDGKKVPVSVLLTPEDQTFIENQSPNNDNTQNDNLTSPDEDNATTENPSNENELTGNSYEYFSIQLGSFAESPDQSKLKLDDIKIIFENGSYKALYGSYGNYNEALIVQKKLISEGYEKAFIVHYKDGNRIGIRNGNRPTNVEYNKSLLEIKVQVGSFNGAIPASQKAIFDQLREISQDSQNGVTKVYAGSFTNYEDASAYKKIVMEKGIKDAFLVAFYNGEKITLERALIILKN